MLIHTNLLWIESDNVTNVAYNFFSRLVGFVVCCLFRVRKWCCCRTEVLFAREKEPNKAKPTAQYWHSNGVTALKPLNQCVVYNVSISYCIKNELNLSGASIWFIDFHFLFHRIKRSLKMMSMRWVKIGRFSRQKRAVDGRGLVKWICKSRLINWTVRWIRRANQAQRQMMPMTNN